MNISKECEEYAVYSRRNRAKEPFPIGIKELAMYIRYRGRSKTFRKFLVNLDIHPLHGPEWLKKVNSDPLIKREMRQVIKYWKFDLAESTLPLVGIDYDIDPSYYDATESDEEQLNVKKTTTNKYQKKTKNKQDKPKQTPVLPPPPQFPNVYSVAGPKTKVGFVFASKPVEKESLVKSSNKPSTKVNHSKLKAPNITNITEPSLSIGEKKPSPLETTLAQVVPSTPTPTDTPKITPSPSTSSVKTTPKITPSTSTVKTTPKTDPPPSKSPVKNSKPEVLKAPSDDDTYIKHPVVVIQILKHTKKRRNSSESISANNIPKKVSKRSKPVVNEQKSQTTTKSRKTQSTQETQQPGIDNKKISLDDMEWVDVKEPVPEDAVDKFIYDCDTEFTDEIYEAYLYRLDQIEKRNLERGIRVVEPELMVLSHVAIERYAAQ